MTSPHDEEYSRLTDPGRYRIVHERARAWATVLEDSLGARAEVLSPAREVPAFQRGVRLVPPNPDALPILLLERDVSAPPEQETLAILDIAVVRPDVVLETQPDCGCDACDSGSNDLLEAVDAAIGHIVGGPFVVLRGKDWQAQWHAGGGSAHTTGRSPASTS